MYRDLALYQYFYAYRELDMRPFSRQSFAMLMCPAGKLPTEGALNARTFNGRSRALVGKHPSLPSYSQSAPER
jgi:hypothetical protein